MQTTAVPLFLRKTMQTTAVFAPTLSNSPERASAAPAHRYLFLRGLALYALAAVILSALIFAVPGYLSTDDYYHARISEQFIVQGRVSSSLCRGDCGWTSPGCR